MGVFLYIFIFFGFLIVEILPIMELGGLNKELLCINNNLKKVEIKSIFIRKFFPHEDVFSASFYKIDYQMTVIVFSIELYYYLLTFLTLIFAVIVSILYFLSIDEAVLMQVVKIFGTVALVSLLLCYFIKYTLPLLIKGPKKK